MSAFKGVPEAREQKSHFSLLKDKSNCTNKPAHVKNRKSYVDLYVLAHTSVLYCTLIPFKYMSCLTNMFEIAKLWTGI